MTPTKRQLLFLVLTVLAVAVAVRAQEPSAPRSDSASAAKSSQPAAQEKTETPPKAATPDYSSEPFVIESYSTTARFENDGTGERNLEVRVRVQNDAGAHRLGELVFGYNSTNEKAEVRYLRVKKHDGRTIADAGVVTDVTPENLRDAPAYADYKEKHIKVAGLEIGDVVDYGISTRIVVPFAQGQFWYDHDFIDAAIVLDERLEINLPAARKIILRSADAHFTQEETAGRKIYRWKRTNLAVQPARDSGDPSSDAPPKKAGAGGPNTPAIELTSFGTWDEIGKWYANLQRDSSAVPPEVRAKAVELTRDRRSRIEQIKALDEFVAKRILYVNLPLGLDGYKPHTAAETLAHGYGDSKDKHVLLAALLAAIGEHADAVLVSSSRRADPLAPSPSQFDRVITFVAPGANRGLTLWLDANSDVAPFRYLIPNLRGKKALRISADGNAIFAQTPKDPPFLSTQDVNVDGHVSPLGKLTAKIHYRLRGDNEFAFRSALHSAPESQWKQIGQTVAMLDGFHGDVSKIAASELTATDKPLELTLDYTQKSFLDWTAKSSKVPVPLPALGLPDLPSDKNAAISLGAALAVTLRLTLAFPAGDAVGAPTGVAVARDYAEYHSAYSARENVLTAQRVIRFETRELPASRSADYQAFARAVIADGSQIVSIENPTASATSIPSTAKAAELVEAGTAALDAGDAQRALDLLKRAAELEPGRKDLWNVLGLAQLRLEKFDEAIAAFRKQIEVNPADDVVYNYLGVTLVRQQKLDQAAAAFRKQVERKPLDKFAYASLGLVLVQQKKYADAIPELEKAAALAPDNAQLQLTLADTYLDAGNNKDAALAFEKAAKISPAPATLNNIAYMMTQKDLDLDRAEEYALTAVNAVTTELKNTDLDHLTDNDLAAVQNLGSYWDTLGWVRERRGDLDAAEPFLRAAWKLTQSGNIGDHLGQLYEARGQKDLAAHTYLLALAAPYAAPDTPSHFKTVTGGAAPSDDALKQARADLASSRIFSVKNSGTEGAEAEFWLLLVPAENGSRAEAVKFIGGSDSLKPYAGDLRALDFGVMFPNATPTKLLRRGKLACTTNAIECTFILNRPEEVRTAE
jgi:tetratricopeptide (TPR) repeat protein